MISFLIGGCTAVLQPLVGAGETGRDEETATNLLKKQQAIEAEVDSYEYSIKALRALAQSLVEADHFDKANIEKRRVRIVGRPLGCRPGGGGRLTRLRLHTAAPSR